MSSRAVDREHQPRRPNRRNARPADEHGSPVFKDLATDERILVAVEVDDGDVRALSQRATPPCSLGQSRAASGPSHLSVSKPSRARDPVKKSAVSGSSVTTRTWARIEHSPTPCALGSRASRNLGAGGESRKSLVRQGVGRVPPQRSGLRRGLLAARWVPGSDAAYPFGRDPRHESRRGVGHTWEDGVWAEVRARDAGASRRHHPRSRVLCRTRPGTPAGPTHSSWSTGRRARWGSRRRFLSFR